MTSAFVCVRCVVEGASDPIVRQRFEQYEVRTEVRRADRSESIGSFTEEKLCKRHAVAARDELLIEHGRRAVGVQEGLGL